MRPFSTEAIILRRTNYGEADRILNVLTPERGKISAVAKGIRKPKSKLAGGLELFAVCDVTIMTGRRELGLVTSARMKRFFAHILKDYDRMQLGYETIKLINRATETIAEPEFYVLLRDAFGWLDDLSIGCSLSELCFRLRLRFLLGHGINVATDHAGGRLKAHKKYHYNFIEHSFVEDTKGRFASEHITLLRLASTKDPAVLRTISGLERVIDDCIWLVRAIGE